MLKIDYDKTIHLTRGDIGAITVDAKNAAGEDYSFKAGDILRFKVFERKDCNCVVLSKDALVEDESLEACIVLNTEDTKIGDLINKPKDYWYEVELNPNTAPQTIIGYDEDGPKILKLYPEGSDM